MNRLRVASIVLAVMALGGVVLVARGPATNTTVADDTPPGTSGDTATPTPTSSLDASHSVAPTATPDGGPKSTASRSGGAQAPYVLQPSLSRNGAMVAFISRDALTSGDTNGMTDVFVRSRSTHKTSRVSISTSGEQANGGSGNPAISADGMTIAFISLASNLVDGDTNGVSDVFIRDLLAHTTTRVSVSSSGVQANEPSGSASFSTDGKPGPIVMSSAPSISSDGRYVAFESMASNLVADDGNGALDVFVHDVVTGTTFAASIAPDGSTGNDGSKHPSIAGDGRSVAFDSKAIDLIAGQKPSTGFNVFVRDLDSSSTTQASVSSDGSSLDGQSEFAFLSGSGRYVAFVLIPDNYSQGADGNQEILVRDLATATTKQVFRCGQGDPCDRVAVSENASVVTWTTAYVGLDPFCYVSGIRAPIAACGLEWIVVSQDGRYVGFEAGIDPYSLDDNQFGGDFGAMIYDRVTKDYTAAWKI
jgi:Tol biopolymer transport system component